MSILYGPAVRGRAGGWNGATIGFGFIMKQRKERKGQGCTIDLLA